MRWATANRLSLAMTFSLRPSIHMTWRDLCFMHWRADAAALRPLIPDSLEIDQFDGAAWVGVVPFEMRDTRISPLPAVPGVRHFPELNLRTYVKHGDRPGVWFFSLDAGSKVAVRAARQTFALPYFDAEMSIKREPGGAIQFASQRQDRFGGPPAALDVRFRPCGPEAPGEPGSLEHFLTERYSLFAQRGYGVPRSLRGGLLRGDIEHSPWPLQAAEVELGRNDMFQIAGLEIPEEPPLLHFAGEVNVRAFPPRRVGP